MKGYKIATYALLSLPLMGISANAGRNIMAASATDSVKTADSAQLKIPEGSIIDQVVWIVGDEPILKSDVEMARMQAAFDNKQWDRDPDCAIPEQIAVQKLFLHQADIDSIEVKQGDVNSLIDEHIRDWVRSLGSEEKLEEYRKQTIKQMKEEMYDDVYNNRRMMLMQQKIVGDITVTPSEVRKYFKNIPEDSLPEIPTEVEVEIITHKPRISKEEINRVKDELREYTERINNGDITFATAARLYSEDEASGREGGELGFMGRATLDPAFANVAFNLTDPKKISKIVESDFGFHIIQLIDKRGNMVNVRHILKRPKVSQGAIDSTLLVLDSLAQNIRDGKFSFYDAAIPRISDDKNTNNNHGLMYNVADNSRTSRFQMKDLPREVASMVETMQVGEVSKAFLMKNDRNNDVCAIIRLRSRRDKHKADIKEDFQVMQNIVLANKRDKILHEWVVNKIKEVYVKMDDKYKGCDFEYQGWIK